MYHLNPNAQENPYAENDSYYEAKATLEALERMTPEQCERAKNADKDGYDTREDRYEVCSDCGQSGYSGQYPFSTLPGRGVCDDCV